jgi:glyoxylase-like metal-dependent hydrolase (beta-lactamase superfamily II)
MAHESVDLRAMEEEFKRTKVMELAADFWMIGGYIGQPASVKKSSSNSFIMLDGDSLILVDPGFHAYFRKKQLEIIRRYAGKGVKRLILLLTHGHFDHIANNDVILEAGIPDVHFLLQEPGVEIVDLNVYAKDIEELMQYYDARSYEPFYDARTEFAGIRTLAERAEVLPLRNRVKHKIGEVELEGWEVGRFFAIHDAGHSPDHICIYDPKHKILLIGDLTVEINPPLLNGSLGKSIEMLKKARRLVEQGDVQLVADAHRSSAFLPSMFKALGVKPLGDLEMVDMVKGQDECSAFLRMWESYYTQLREETLAAHKRIGEATVPEIVQELSKSTNPAVVFKKAIAFPVRPSRMGVMVASILKETGVKPRKEGNRIVFAPKRP